MTSDDSKTGTPSEPAAEPQVRDRAPHDRDRIELLGTLAAGVAHEINNPLTYTKEAVGEAIRELEELAGSMPALRPVVALLQGARDATEQAWMIARDVRMFSRRASGAVGAVDLQRVLDATVRMARHEISKHATLERDYDGISPVEGSEVGLGQVFLNLVVNALQAIPAGDPKAHRISIRGREEPGWVIVEVSDSGSGISEELLQHIFDPYFTTKPEGVGTGLGLSISRDIVSSFGGTILVHSELGRGTTFTVSLRAMPRESLLSSRPPSRMGRVLVVDDDPLVAEAVRLALAAENEVAVASSGVEALAMLAEGDGFDAIFCDLMMPEMDGMRFYDEVSRVAGAVTEVIAFLSGGVDDEATEIFLARTGRPVLEKPFDPEGLREYVRERVRREGPLTGR